MRRNTTENEVAKFTQSFADIYFKPNALLEWEDIDEFFDAVQALMKHKQILRRRRKMIQRGVSFGIDDIMKSNDEQMKVRFAVVGTRSVMCNARTYIDVLLAIGKDVDYDQFVSISKLLKVLPNDCPAADIQFIDI